MYFFSEGFVLGLSTGIHCFSVCMPVLFPYALAKGGRGFKKPLLILFQFLAGRFLAYSIFALLASFLGTYSSAFIPKWIPPVLLILTGLLLFGSFLSGFKKFSFCGLRKSRISNIFVLGFLLGINVCPPFVAGFVRLLNIANILWGFVYFSGFFLATSLFLLPVLLPGPFYSERIKQIGKMALLIAALWQIVLGIGYLSH